MAERTAISWADATFNPWLGCQKVSPACDFCYAEELCGQRLGVDWGPHAARRRTADSTWRHLSAWNSKPEKLTSAPEGTKPFVFGGSLCDVFDNKADPIWRRDYFDMLREIDKLVVLLLTKRGPNIVDMVEEAGGLPKCVALGHTFEDQPRWDTGHVPFRRASSRLRPLFTFGSFEPLLGPIDTRGGFAEQWRCKTCRRTMDSHQTATRRGQRECPTCLSTGLCDQLERLAPINWLITGGESGKNARDAKEEWFLALHEQAKCSAVRHHKQNGGRGWKKGGHLLAGQEIRNRPYIPLPPKPAPAAPELPLAQAEPRLL